MATNTTTQNVISQTALPDWYSQYLQGVLGQAVGAAGEQYQPYTGPLVAPLTPAQQQAAASVQNAQGMGHEQIQQGLDLTNQAAGVNSGAAGAGAYGQASDIYNNVAGATTSGISQPYVQSGTDYLNQAAQGSSLAAANPYIQESVSPTGLGAAAPFLSDASQSTPDVVSQYENPYNSAVTDQIATLGARNLAENILPQVGDAFIRAGQYGSQQMGTVGERAIRDTNQDILNAQTTALQQGYGQAQTAAQTDLARQAALAGTAGGLGTTQQQIEQGAGTAVGNLSATDLSRLAAAGVNIGNLGISQAGVAGSDLSRQLSAGQGLQGIGQSQIQAAQTDAARQLAAGQQDANIAGQAQQDVFGQIAGLDASGQEQQQQTQNNYNAAYGQYQQQQQYPWTQISNESNVIQGLPVNTSTSQTSTTQTPAPSVGQQVAGIGLGVAGLANSGLFKAKGGRVKYKRTHSYGNAPKRGIAFMEAA